MTFRCCPSQAYFLQSYDALPAGLPAHALGGPETSRESCPRCDRRLWTLLSLDASDRRLELTTTRLIHLPLCVCSVCHQAQYTIADDGEVISIPGSQTDSASFATKQLVPPASSPIALHAVPDRIAEARTLAAEGRLDEAGLWASDYDWNTPTNQVGGRPAAAGGKLPSPACPLCGTNPPFLATIACDIASPVDTAAPDQIQVFFFLCRECPAVIATGPEAAHL